MLTPPWIGGDFSKMQNFIVLPSGLPHSGSKRARRTPPLSGSGGKRLLTQECIQAIEIPLGFLRHLLEGRPTGEPIVGDRPEIPVVRNEKRKYSLHCVCDIH